MATTVASGSVHSDPKLAEVFELLHRMELCQSEPFVWMAREAINKLQQYEVQAKANQSPAFSR